MSNAYPEWNRLLEILGAIKAQGIQKLSADEIIEFGKLYRRVVADLSFHRTHEADPKRVSFLNDLAQQCYPYVYEAPRRPWPSFWSFFTTDFPRGFRKNALAILLAFLVSMIPAVIGFLMTWHDRTIADQVLPPELMGHLDYIAKRHHNAQDWMPLLERAPNAGFIMQNNIKVAIASFAGGMTAGLLTIYLMIFNGVMIGVVAAAVALDGWHTSLNFWAFVAPHGVFELTAIFIAGGAGLLLAYAIVNPGEFPRRVALMMAGREALKLMLGVTAMLVIAAFIEGFFSPLNIPEYIKLAVASGEAVLLFGYLFFAGRKKKDAEPEQGGPVFGKLLMPLPPM